MVAPPAGHAQRRASRRAARSPRRTGSRCAAIRKVRIMISRLADAPGSSPTMLPAASALQVDGGEEVAVGVGWHGVLERQPEAGLRPARVDGSPGRRARVCAWSRTALVVRDISVRKPEMALLSRRTVSPSACWSSARRRSSTRALATVAGGRPCAVPGGDRGRRLRQDPAHRVVDDGGRHHRPERPEEEHGQKGQERQDQRQAPSRSRDGVSGSWRQHRAIVGIERHAHRRPDGPMRAAGGSHRAVKLTWPPRQLNPHVIAMIDAVGRCVMSTALPSAGRPPRRIRSGRRETMPSAPPRGPAWSAP